MNTETRRAVAFIAGSAASGRGASSIYDYSAARYTSFSGCVADNVSVYDYDANCHISGTLPSLFHYGENAHLSLKLDGDRFSGFDYGTSSHFSGTIRGGSISLYDYNVGQYFNFTL